jgi:hypothetical protein
MVVAGSGGKVEWQQSAATIIVSNNNNPNTSDNNTTNNTSAAANTVGQRVSPFAHFMNAQGNILIM